MEHEYVKNAEYFLSQIQRESDMKNYIAILLASYLDGYTEQQKFILWTGIGSNGRLAIVVLQAKRVYSFVCIKSLQVMVWMAIQSNCGNILKLLILTQ